MLENKTVENEEVEIDLVELFGYLLHWIWLIVICGLATGLAGFLVSAFLITPEYQSTTGIYVMSRQSGDTLTYSDTQLANQLTKDYEELIISRTVLENVIAEKSLPDTYESLKKRISVSNTSDTRILYITVTDTDPVRAMDTANAIRELSAEHILAVTEVKAVNTVDEANLPTGPSAPSIRKNTAMAAAVGLILCMAILVIRFLLDDTIKTSEDVEKYLGWGTLALIPVIEENQERRKVSKKNPVSSGKESKKEDKNRETRETREAYAENTPQKKQNPKEKNKDAREKMNRSPQETKNGSKENEQAAKEQEHAKNAGNNSKAKDAAEAVPATEQNTGKIEEIEEILVE